MTSLDYFLRNDPIDQVAVERPYLQWLMEGKKSYPGAKQYVVEQIRDNYGSNFQWFNGSKTVTYNKRKTVKQVSFPWSSAHDGFALDEDRLAQNGINIIEGKTKTATSAEVIQLTDLLREQNEVLRLGFEEKFSLNLQQDGTQDADAIVGLDLLIQSIQTDGTTITWATVGGINSATAGNEYWRNNSASALDATVATGTLDLNLEKSWRACVRNGGSPDHIEAGGDFVDALRSYMLNKYGRVDYGPMQERKTEVGSGSGKNVDTGLYFHGVPIKWNPEFDNLSPRASETAWSKRCYFLNSKHFKQRPLTGHDMITRKPPRAYDKYEYYFGLTWRGSLTTNRRNAHAVNAIA